MAVRGEGLGHASFAAANVRDPTSLAFARSGFRVLLPTQKCPDGTLCCIGCAVRDSNPRPFRCKRIALPTELTARFRTLPAQARLAIHDSLLGALGGNRTPIAGLEVRSSIH